MAIEQLLAALAQRAQAQRLGMQGGINADTSTIMQIARLNEEKSNRKALREDAARRLREKDAANVVAVQMAEQERQLDQDSYQHGLKIGMEDPSIADTPLPKRFNANELDRGMTAGRTMKTAQSNAAKTKAKMDRDAEAAKLSGILSAELAKSGGDPRALIANPEIFAKMDPTKQMAARKYAGILDAADAEKAGDSGLLAFEQGLSGLDDPEKVYGAKVPDGVDPSKAGAAVARRIGSLNAIKGKELEGERLSLTKERWAVADERTAAAVEKGDWNKALEHLNTEIDNLSGQIAQGRDKQSGRPRNPEMDKILVDRKEAKMREYEQVSKKAPGKGKDVDPRLKELRQKVKDGSASPEEAEEYLKMTGK